VEHSKQCNHLYALYCSLCKYRIILIICAQVNSHRHYFVCQTIVKVAPTTLLDKTKADSIYALESGEGHLLVLQYSPENGKKHSTVENSVAELDRFLMSLRGSNSTSFFSLGDYRTCKVKSFSREDRVNDPDFRKLVDVSVPKVNGKYVPPPGVVIWDRALLDEERRVADAAREAEDIRVQQQVMEADPEAFGGNSSMGPGSKMLDPMSSVMGSADDGAGGVLDESGKDEVIQSPDPKPNGKRRAEVSSIDEIELERMHISRRVSDGNPCSVEGGMQEEVILRLREGLEENEELKRELVAAKEKAVSVFFPLFAPDSIDPSFDRRRTSVC
jgi:hypothetical protein